MDTKNRLLRSATWTAAIVITAVAVAFHIYYWLHVGGLWRDEVNLLNLAVRNSLADMAKDAFPVLMPLTFHGWTILGNGSDLYLRFFGLMVGIGILATLWISSWKVRREPPLAGLVLFSLNSTAIFFGDSLRAYGLGSLLAAAMVAAAFVFLQNPSVLRAAWLALFAILSVQTLYHNAVMVAAVCFGAWAVCWRRKDGRAAVKILIVAAISALSLLPYAHTLFSTGDASLHTGVELPRLFATYTDTLGYPRSGYIYIWVLLYVAIIVCTCTSASLSSSSSSSPSSSNLTRDLSLFAAITLTVAVVGFPLFFWRSRMPMQSWYLLPFMASAAVCFDAAVPVSRAMWRAVILIFAVVTACLSIPSTATILTGHFSNVDLYARQLSAAAATDDYIIVEPWHIGITFGYYFKGHAPWNTLPPLSDHSTHRFDLVQQEMQNTNTIAPVMAQMQRTLQSGHRVWILALDGWMGVPGPGMKPPASLPPAPLPRTGWADYPYAKVWAAQTACYLAGHSTKFQELKSLSRGRYIAEDMDVFVADGWRTNAIQIPMRGR